MLSHMDVIENAGGGYGPPPGGGFVPPPGGYGPPGTPGAPPPGPPFPHGPYAGGLQQPYGVAPGAPYGIEPTTGLPYSDKQKIVAGLLQIVFPGVGRIYAGHTGIGIAQLVALFFCVGAIWGFVDGILILAGKVKDGEGRPLRD